MAQAYVRKSPTDLYFKQVDGWSGREIYTRNINEAKIFNDWMPECTSDVYVPITISEQTEADRCEECSKVGDYMYAGRSLCLTHVRKAIAADILI